MMRFIQILLVLGILGVAIVPVFADEATVPLPTIPKAEGDTCVAEPAFMRENHMNLLKHDRDESVQDGNRNIEYSLKECIDCHVVRDDVGQPVSAENPKHFCRSCHEYVAVKIDCFSCHNSKPDEDNITSMANPHNKHASMQLPQVSWPLDALKGGGDE